MQNKDILNLISDESFCRYCLGTNAEDVKYWENWLNDHPAERSEIEMQKIMVILLAGESAVQVPEGQYEELQQKIRSTEKTPSRVFPLIVRWSVAASLVISISVVYYFYQKGRPKSTIAQQTAPIIVPGSNKATLTLASGQTILLSNAKNENLAVEFGMTISNTAEGQLIYKAVKENETSFEKLSYNTLTTPAGGQYQVILPDGSHVWLNAQSTLKYPARFSGNKREISLTGEGYFEVTHDKLKPFVVKSNNQEVEVLGTHFDIMAYGDDAVIKTTLLKGSVRVTQNGESKMLKPGEQSTVTGDQITVSDNIDVEDVVSWKNGYFKYHEPLKDIMQKIARWYDVKIVYDPKTDQNNVFAGRVPRSKNLPDVLSLIEQTGNVHFEVKGRSITVMP